MKLCFIAWSITFDVRTPTLRPLGGSESSICYLATALAQRGHEVHLLSSNDAPGTYEQCHCHHLPDTLNAAFFQTQRFDAVVLVNWLDGIPLLRCDMLPAHTPLIFWCHHDADQPAVEPLSDHSLQTHLTSTVFISGYQKKRLIAKTNLEGSKTHVIGNGLTPAFADLFESPQSLLDAKQASETAVYTSTPFRGLHHAFDIMADGPTDLQLQSFSGMSVYQADDTAYADLFAYGNSLPNVELFGPVSQPELAQHLKAASYFVYPNTFAETFCIAAIEALAAGLDVITVDRGALRETCGDYGTLISADLLDHHPSHAIKRFRSALNDCAVYKRTNPLAWATTKFEQSRAISRAFSWNLRAAQWEALLGSYSL